MNHSWVVNASPLILLAKVGRIDLLLGLTGKLVIPASVVAEIQAGPSGDPAGQWLRGVGAQWVQTDAPPDPAIAAWDLGAGETAVLNWAYRHREYEAILDDRAASCLRRVRDYGRSQWERQGRWPACCLPGGRA